ncbi:AAI domain-containing protein [Citrus sinensis]|uniref:AAI domain-containing protein n=1 Tax=Citrus sinensis TaxID=2711 RepID=A0ACB8LTT1_CITSI|nr:AAI domain-containing protein [Citrus sinensis]
MGSMKKKNSCWSSFVMLRVACVLLLMMMMDGRVKRCSKERRLGVNACKPIIYGQPPSPACCQRVRVSHVECVCPAITPKLAALSVIRLIEGCGRRVPRHFKCGSITTP